MYRPTYFIGNFIMRQIIYRSGLNLVFIKMFSGLFSVLPSLILSVGVIPTFRVLLYLRRYIMAGHTLPMVRVLLNNIRFNGFAVSTIINAIAPYWEICLKVNYTFQWLFNIYLTLSLLGLSRRLLFYLIRTTVVMILGSFGILTSEFLSGIQYLKMGSDYILDIAQDVFKFKIPKKVVETVLDPVDIENNININDIADSSNGYREIISIIGLVVLGTVGVIVVVCLTDYYAPQITREIPYVGSFVDAIHNTWNATVQSVQSTWNNSWNSVYQFIYGSNSDLPGTPPANTPNIPESISRSSSTDSNSTIKLSDFRTITPPSTPEPIDPMDMLSSEIPPMSDYTDYWE
jgi:hypothetical protein